MKSKLLKHDMKTILDLKVLTNCLNTGKTFEVVKGIPEGARLVKAEIEDGKLILYLEVGEVNVSLRTVEYPKR